MLIASASGILLALLAVPLTITVARYLLLQEAAPGSWLDTRSQRVRHVAAASVLIHLLSEIPSLIVRALPGFQIEGLVGGFLAALLLIPFTLRLMVLVPAIATDAEDADLVSIGRATRGRLWFLFWEAFLGMLPAALIALILLIGLLWAAGLRPDTLVFNVAFAPIMVLLAATYAAVSARLFARLPRTIEREDAG